MVANINPIFSRLADVQWASGYLVTANTTADLTSGTTALIFTADATAGGFLRTIVAKPSPAGNNVQTVARIWINNGGVLTTAANNVLFTEQTLPAITASATVAQVDVVIPMSLALPAGFRVYATIHTAVASGWAFSGVGGRY